VYVARVAGEQSSVYDEYLPCAVRRSMAADPMSVGNNSRAMTLGGNQQ
jgi:hypothetical protein